MKFTDALDGYWLDKEFQLKPKTVHRYSYVMRMCTFNIR